MQGVSISTLVQTSFSKARFVSRATALSPFSPRHTSMAAPSPEVLHNPDSFKFFIPLETGEEAVLCYSRLPGGSLDLYHTEVPPSQRGQGLGAVLAKAALTHARTSGVKVQLTCTYLQHYLTKHPENKDLVMATS